ncbi:MAG: prenyltransferase/squalene oxidase repeat-containing protein [Pirellulales bacterium]
MRLETPSPVEPPEASPDDAPLDAALPAPRYSRTVAPWAVSMVVHATLLIVLALVALERGAGSLYPHLVTASRDPLPQPERLDAEVLDLAADDASLDAELIASETQRTPGELDLDPSPLPPSGLPAGLELSPQDLTRQIDLGPGPAIGGGFQGRAPEARAALVGARGGTPESEAAVEAGLKWLAAHQQPDGSWRFDLHEISGCDCANPGRHQSVIGATGLALLPFLGAGYTHQEGKYQQVVHRGLYYIMGRAVDSPQGIDLRGGDSMYTHGLATLALCEAYAMTGDRSIKPIAQGAIDYIVHAQHQAGGWRYFPGQAGDTTVTGWQVLALKSGYLAGLNIPRHIWYKIGEFLDSKGTRDGSNYGYTRVDRDDTNSAIGLLCRMMLGWDRQHQGLRGGVTFLAQLGPSETNLYYDYYATQVMHHFHDQRWERWNVQMREHLIRTQATDGHEAGSWFFSARHTDVAGRLFNTAMAVMILEVYYRHMPLYSEDALVLP